MSSEWTRQVLAGRLAARVFTIGGRPTYRFTHAAVDEFLARFSIEAKGDGRPVALERPDDSAGIAPGTRGVRSGAGNRHGVQTSGRGLRQLASANDHQFR